MHVTFFISIILVLFEGPFGMKDVLRIGYFQSPEAAFEKQDENNVTQVIGYYVELVQWMSRDTKFNYSMVKVDNSDVFNSVRRDMYLKDIDFALPSYGVSVDRIKFVTFLTPVETVEYTLVMPYPKRESDAWSFLRPFSLTVWLGTAICLVIIPLFLKITGLEKRRKGSDPNESRFASWTDAMMYALGVITNQGGYWSSKTQTSRLVAAIWCLGAFVLVNAYSSLLITYLTAPKLSLLVQSIQELAEREDIQVLAQQGTFIWRQLQSVEGSLEPIRANMARIPEDHCGTIWAAKKKECLEQVKTGGFVYITSLEEAQHRINDDFSIAKTCSLTYTKNTFFSHNAAFIATVNITQDLRNSLDVSILKAFSYGLIGEFRSFIFSGYESPCTHYGSQNQELKKLTLVDFISAFVLLAVGYSFSIIALIYEVARKRLNSRGA